MDKLVNFLPEQESKLLDMNKRSQAFLSDMKGEKIEEINYDGYGNLTIKKED